MSDNHILSVDEPRFVVTDWAYDAEQGDFVLEGQRVEEYIDPGKREPEDEFTCSCGMDLSSRECALSHLKESVGE